MPVFFKARHKSRRRASRTSTSAFSNNFEPLREEPHSGEKLDDCVSLVGAAVLCAPVTVACSVCRLVRSFSVSVVTCNTSNNTKKFKIFNLLQSFQCFKLYVFTSGYLKNST